MTVSDNLHLRDLSDDEKRVMKALYEHQRQVDASQDCRINKRVYVMLEEALSPGRMVEQALREKGLVCRSARGEDYAYAISFDGYEWYQREGMLRRDEDQS